MKCILQGSGGGESSLFYNVYTTSVHNKSNHSAVKEKKKKHCNIFFRGMWGICLWKAVDLYCFKESDQDGGQRERQRAGETKLQNSVKL